MKKKTKLKKPKTPKKVNISKLKKLAWHYFSVYIRTRDSDESGFARCYSCGVRVFWKSAQAGHFVPGRRNAILFDERGVHAQCYACNIYLHGNTLNYLDHMLNDYGQVVVDDLRRLEKTVKQFTNEELTSFIEELKIKIKEIQCNKNLY